MRSELSCDMAASASWTWPRRPFNVSRTWSWTLATSIFSSKSWSNWPVPENLQKKIVKLKIYTQKNSWNWKFIKKNSWNWKSIKKIREIENYIHTTAMRFHADFSRLDTNYSSRQVFDTLLQINFGAVTIGEFGQNFCCGRIISCFLVIFPQQVEHN